MKKISVCIILFFVILIFSASCYAEEKLSDVFPADSKKNEEVSVATVCRVVYWCKLIGILRKTRSMCPVLAQHYADDLIRGGLAANVEKVCK